MNKRAFYDVHQTQIKKIFIAIKIKLVYWHDDN